MNQRSEPSDTKLLRRRRLAERFLGSGPAIASITAPMGYGKTTLLHEIRESASRASETSEFGETVALYLDVEEADHNPGALLDLIRAAIEVAIPKADLRPLDMMKRGAPPEEYGSRLSYVLSRVLQPIEVDHVLILLDNLHALEPGDGITQMLLGLFRDRPAKVGFVLASRHRNPIDPQVLRGANGYLQLVADDLAFTYEEMFEVLAPYSQDDEVAAWIPSLRVSTGGWPGVVGLIRDMFQSAGPDHTRELLRDLQGGQESITDYVVGLIVDDFDDEMQAFMKRLAVFPWVTPLAREAVAHLWNPETRRFEFSPKGKKSSGASEVTDALIDRLRSSQILSASRRGPDTLEFNELVRSSLYRLFSLDDGAALAQVHSCVGHWQVEQDGPLDPSTLDHLVSAGDWEIALELLEANVERFFNGGQHARVRQWLAALERTQEELPYWANYYRGRTAATYGDWDLSRKALELCKKQLLRTKSIRQAWRWQAKVSLGFAWMYWRRGMQSETRTYCRRGLDFLAQAERRGLIPKKHAIAASEVRLELVELLGTAKLAAGAYDRAALVFEEALKLATEIGSRRAEAASLSRLGLIAMRQGQHRAACKRLQLAVQLLDHDEDADLFARASYLLGFTLVMMGEFDDGIYHLHTAYDAVIDSGRPTTVARVLATIGRIYGSLGLMDESADSFSRALDLILPTQDIHTKVEILDCYASALAYNGRPLEAKLLLQQSASLLSSRNRNDAHLAALHAEASATLDAAAGHYAQAFSKIDRAIDRQRQLGAHYDAQRLAWRKGMWLHQAFCAGELSTPEEAFEVLDACCSRALQNGFIFEVGAAAEEVMYAGMCYGTESMRTYCCSLLQRLGRPTEDLGPINGMSETTAARYKDYRRRADLDEEYVIIDREDARGANARQVNQLVDDFGDDHLVLLVPEQLLVHKGDDISLSEKRVILPLLLHFLRNPTKAFTMSELAEAVWGAKDDGSMQTKVKVAISRLRALLGKDRPYIVTQKVDRGGERPIVAYGLDDAVSFYIVERIEAEVAA
jgi:ATP/maltotriose-dependent transcriptional regulator MalT